MSKRRRPKYGTRYQRILRLIEDGECGLLPLDFSCRCPRRAGPPHPHPEHPGQVGHLTCSGCCHNADLYFTTRVCTHPQARQVAARWRAEAIQRWEAEQRQVERHQPSLF